uniref:Putative ovule protein n=1 Tax=Solanum chacoense TaxID=4108 RepID=A0A0V0HTI1_SOLCH
MTKLLKGLSDFTRISLLMTILTPDYSSLNILHRCITKEDNDMFCTLPTLKELLDCVFSLDLDSAPRLDGLSGYFYQNTYSIIASDLHKAVTAFFTGDILPKNCILILVLFLFLRLITPNLFLI